MIASTVNAIKQAPVSLIAMCVGIWCGLNALVSVVQIIGCMIIICLRPTSEWTSESLRINSAATFEHSKMLIGLLRCSNLSRCGCQPRDFTCRTSLLRSHLLWLEAKMRNLRRTGQKKSITPDNKSFKLSSPCPPSSCMGLALHKFDVDPVCVSASLISSWIRLLKVDCSLHSSRLVTLQTSVQSRHTAPAQTRSCSQRRTDNTDGKQHAVHTTKTHLSPRASFAMDGERACIPSSHTRC